MRCARIAFFLGKHSQLLPAWFQELQISALLWDLICIPYGLFVVCMLLIVGFKITKDKVEQYQKEIDARNA